MRYIKNLCYDTRHLLKRIYKNSRKHEVRQKAKCLLLSFQGYSIIELSEIFEVHFNTIYAWFNAWETEKLLSLYHAKGQGRKPKINADSQELVAKMIAENPKQIDKIIVALSDEKSIKVSRNTVKRLLKKNFF